LIARSSSQTGLNRTTQDRSSNSTGTLSRAGQGTTNSTYEQLQLGRRPEELRNGQHFNAKQVISPSLGKVSGRV
jgi:hypothetical protein